MISKKLVLILSLGVAGSLMPAYGAACSNGATLASLEALSGTGCDIGGLNFSNFLWTPTGANPHSTPTDTQVTITTLLNANGTGFLLNFSAPFTAGGGGFADGELKYTVKTVSGLNTINSLYAQIDGSVTGTGSYDDVLDNYCLGLASLSCSPSALDAHLGPGGVCGPGTTDGAGGCKNSVSVAAQNIIAIRKDIRADATAGAPGASAAVTGVINQFGPAVPEPGTYVLSFIGLGLMFFGSKKFSRS